MNIASLAPQSLREPHFLVSFLVEKSLGEQSAHLERICLSQVVKNPTRPGVNYHIPRVK